MPVGNILGQLEQRIQKKYVVDCKACKDNEIRKIAENVFDVLRGPFLILDADRKVLTANHAFYEAFQLSPEDTEGVLIYHLDGRRWDIPELRELLEETLPLYGNVADFALEHSFHARGVRKVVLNAREVFLRGRGGCVTILSMEDATAQADAGGRDCPAHYGGGHRAAERKGDLRQALEYLAKEMVDRKRAEDEARESEDYFRLLLRNLGEDIILIGSDYRIVDVANETLVTSGLARSQIIGTPCFQTLHGHDAPCDGFGDFCPLPQIVETGCAFTGRHLHRRMDGSSLWVDVLLSPMCDEAGTVTHMIEAVRDTSRSRFLKA